MSMDAASRAVEFTVLSAENLRTLAGKPVKKNAFVVVKIDSFNHESTKADYQGGSYPSWDEKLELTMPVRTSRITVEVKYRSGSVERAVGMAKIPVSDFLGGYAPDNYLHFLSYRLRDTRGERNGIINVSVRVKAAQAEYARQEVGKNVEAYGWSSSAASSASSSLLKPQMGMPAGEKGYDGGVVTGVPLRCASRA